MAPGRGTAPLPKRQDPKQCKSNIPDCGVSGSADYDADFKDSPFYEIAETVLSLTDIPGTFITFYHLTKPLTNLT